MEKRGEEMKIAVVGHFIHMTHSSGGGKAVRASTKVPAAYTREMYRIVLGQGD